MHTCVFCLLVHQSDGSFALRRELIFILQQCRRNLASHRSPAVANKIGEVASKIAAAASKIAAAASRIAAAAGRIAAAASRFDAAKVILSVETGVLRRR